MISIVLSKPISQRCNHWSGTEVSRVIPIASGDHRIAGLLLHPSEESDSPCHPNGIGCPPLRPAVERSLPLDSPCHPETDVHLPSESYSDSDVPLPSYKGCLNYLPTRRYLAAAPSRYENVGEATEPPLHTIHFFVFIPRIP